ncbi:CYTH domain-containing protein [Candidatus Woesearchaeota archaeon]|nr:CYTH domain-containing protein [Candidatus Woesearchaeota archaeon]
MKEIEVKILDINRKEVVEKLISLGAKKIFDGEIYALFFDFPDKTGKKNTDNPERNSKKTIRLRKMGDKVFLTIKEPIEHDAVKIREEHEVEVSDFEKTRKILESLGLSEWLTMKKHRTSYLVEDVHFELDKHHDQYEYVPEFLEIEARDIDTLYRYVELLGFKREDCKPWTILDIADNLN